MLETRYPYTQEGRYEGHAGPETHYPYAQESRSAKAIESQTVKLPSDLFLWSAVGAIGASLMLQASGRKEDAMFVGQWVPSLLIFGMYNKMVKLLGSE